MAPYEDLRSDPPTAAAIIQQGDFTKLHCNTSTKPTMMEAVSAYVQFPNVNEYIK
jgi:hypothetical protein